MASRYKIINNKTRQSKDFNAKTVGDILNRQRQQTQIRNIVLKKT